jgi:hypothetical protein
MSDFLDNPIISKENKPSTILFSADLFSQPSPRKKTHYPLALSLNSWFFSHTLAPESGGVAASAPPHTLSISADSFSYRP